MKIEPNRQRLKDIRRQLREKGIDCLILTKAVDVTYVTAFGGEDSWAAITPNAVYLITDSRYTEQAARECVRTTLVQRKGPITEAAAQLISKLNGVRTVAIHKSVSVAVFEALKKGLNARLKSVSGITEGLRSAKDATELAKIKKAAALSAKALAKATAFFKPGICESELAGIVDLEIRRLGCKPGFETIVAFGPNASRPHHQPGPRKLKRTDTILIDFGARFDGYTADITRCCVVGRPSAAYRRAYEVTANAQTAAIAAAKAGARLRDVDEAARKVIRDSGLPVYGHGSGHGIGLEIHEDPFLKEDAKGTLQAGQILTIEPGIYIPGKLGVRIEDDILITETGCKILTGACPRLQL
ncbi:MAG: Xaa-Pro peptidase family protein [Sedimentisphaerales bacterium]|jgi:Xaa-Pro aminopeptidase|nr:Xaa-Pro peptidase family protein [Sedimentisphaerales bacterium]